MWHLAVSFRLVEVLQSECCWLVFQQTLLELLGHYTLFRANCSRFMSVWIVGRETIPLVFKFRASSSLVVELNAGLSLHFILQTRSTCVGVNSLFVVVSVFTNLYGLHQQKLSNTWQVCALKENCLEMQKLELHYFANQNFGN